MSERDRTISPESTAAPTGWTALFLPASDRRDPSRNGFATEDEAWAYVYEQMCTVCTQERARALAGDPDADAEPACTAEWLVMETAKYLECDGFEDLMAAGGWERTDRPQSPGE